MTPFQLAVRAVSQDELKVPVVTVGDGKTVPYFHYTLTTHRSSLKLLAAGITFRTVKLKDLKTYYGLRSRSAADCLTEFDQVVVPWYREFLELIS